MLRRGLALLSLASLTAACTSGEGVATHSGELSVAVLSSHGPAAEAAEVVAAASLAQLRATLGCGAPGARCWPDVRTVPKDRLRGNGMVARTILYSLRAA